MESRVHLCQCLMCQYVKDLKVIYSHASVQRSILPLQLERLAGLLTLHMAWLGPCQAFSGPR